MSCHSNAPRSPAPFCFPAVPSRKTGFTLVELAMTALLLSLGLLAVFALLRRGLASRSELESETRGAAFAEAAFNTLRYVSDQAIRASASNDLWTAFWVEFGNGTTNLAMLGDAAWQSADPATPPDDTLFLFGDSLVRTNRLFLLGRAAETNALPDAVVLYQCSVVLTNTFQPELAAYPTNRAEVTLHVWPNAVPNGRAQTFFTLFSNPGRLP